MNRERIADLERDFLRDHPGSVQEPLVFSGPPTPEACRQLPKIGAVTLADGWEKTDQVWFVDSWGGKEEGPALTQDEFLEQLRVYVLAHPRHGYALTGVGQFQVYVSAFEPV